MSDDKKSKWIKIIKVVGEFLVALVTALFASSFVCHLP